MRLRGLVAVGAGLLLAIDFPVTPTGRPAKTGPNPAFFAVLQ